MIDAFLDSPMRPYGGALLAGGGLMAVAAGLERFRAARTLIDPHRALGVARGIRLGIFGLCTVAFAGGWVFSIDWLMFLALIILGQEMLEATVVIAALGDGVRMRDAEDCGQFVAAPAERMSGAHSRHFGREAEAFSASLVPRGLRAPGAPAPSLRGAPRGRLEPRAFVRSYGFERAVARGSTVRFF